MQERRSEHRSSVSWPVRVWLGEGIFVVARAVDASPGGLRLTIPPRAKPVIHVDRSYTVELQAVPAPITCVATVRHACDDVGLAFQQRQAELSTCSQHTEAQATLA